MLLLLVRSAVKNKSSLCKVWKSGMVARTLRGDKLVTSSLLLRLLHFENFTRHVSLDQGFDRSKNNSGGTNKLF